MHLLQVTIASTGTAQPIIPLAVQPASQNPFSVLVVQNNAAHSVRIGDSTVSTTKGILLASGSPGGSQTIEPAIQYTGDLREFWIVGTSGDVIDFMVFD